VSLFSFLVSLKSPTLPDSLMLVALISENMMISIGIIRIHAFHKPNSKAGIKDKHFSPRYLLFLSDYLLKFMFIL
jgi:hypothetical protein